MPRAHVVMLETLLAQALQQNAPVAEGLKSLAASLKLQGNYVVRLRATFEPVDPPAQEQS